MSARMGEKEVDSTRELNNKGKGKRTLKVSGVIFD